METKKYLKPLYLVCALMCASAFSACSSDDDNDGGGSAGGGSDLSIPSSVVDGVRVTGITTSDPENGFSVTYNDDGSPASATVKGTTYNYEYAGDANRATTATGRKLVRVVASGDYGDGNSTWVASNFSFNQDGFLASYKETMSASEYGYTEKAEYVMTFSYNGKGRLQRIAISGTYSESGDGESYSEPVSESIDYTYTGDNLTKVTNTSDGETLDYLYEYGTSTHSNAYNVMTPQLAEGMAFFSPMLYQLVYMGYLGNASAFLPTKMTYHSYSSYTDGNSNYDDLYEYDITYDFWSNNKIKSINCGQSNGYGSYTYNFLYLGE